MMPSRTTRCALPPQEATLASLSTELLFLVAEHLLGNPGGLRGLALTSRRYRPIAQEILFRAPILSIERWNETSPIYLFARTLLEQPRLANCTNMLQINIPFYWGSQLPPSPSITYTIDGAIKVIDRIEWMSAAYKEGWKWQLERLRPLPFCALILSMVPNLTHLYLAPESPHTADDDLLGEIFWSTSRQSMYDYPGAMAQLAYCPGLAGLRHFRSPLVAPLTMPPLIRIASLTSLDLALGDWYQGVEIPILKQVKVLRLSCRLAHLPKYREDPNLLWAMVNGIAPISVPRTSGLRRLYTAIEKILCSFPNLATLDMVARPCSADQEFLQANVDGEDGIISKRYTELIARIISVASCLTRLELPRGWWTRPRHIELAGRYAQAGANTGSVVDLSAFVQLDTLITHSTAIIAKDLFATEVADPVTTLPSSLRHITVYGAHDGLWGWVRDILDNGREHFQSLRTVEMKCEEPVHSELTLSTVKDLKSSHRNLWEKLQGSDIKIFGDVSKV